MMKFLDRVAYCSGYNSFDDMVNEASIKNVDISFPKYYNMNSLEVIANIKHMFEKFKEVGVTLLFDDERNIVTITKTNEKECNNDGSINGNQE